MFKRGAYIFLLLFYHSVCVINANSQPYKTEKEFKTYLLTNYEKLDLIEGIWEFNKNLKSGFTDKKNKSIKLPNFDIGVAPYKVAIIKVSDGNYFCYYINIIDRITEIDACGSYWFKNTAIDGQYIYDVGSSCKFAYHGKAIINSDGDLVFSGKYEEYEDGMFSWDNFSVSATKLSPSQSEVKNFRSSQGVQKIEAPSLSLGTGFAIKNDLILTCFHVVKDAENILIRGINGRFDTAYSANLIYYDQDLDVAVLNVHRSINLLNSYLPYSFAQVEADVGENIFVLGYPLQNTMGQEIKLTTGVISSRSGFLGDTTLFQISAPIQPGNSGGPLFDSKGNVIGIVSAKHAKADNVGYALKLGMISEILKGRSVAFLKNKSNPQALTDKVKLFRDYIYSVEATLKK